MIKEKRLTHRFRPQYITDSAGSRLVVLQQKEYAAIVDDMEDWEDNLLYMQAKLDDDGERISMEDVFQLIETNR